MDTCDTAGDGVCRDGGRAAFGWKCEFGTDCSDCGPRLVSEAPLWSVSERPPSDPPDAGPGFGLDDGLALGGCLLVAVLVAASYAWHRKRLMQKALGANAFATAPRQVEVILSQPETQQPAAAPASLAAILAACGLQHHEKTFQAEGYTLETLRNSIKQGDAAASSDLRELKLRIGECRRLINHLKAGK